MGCSSSSCCRLAVLLFQFISSGNCKMRVGKDTETGLGREGKLGRLAGRSQTFFPDKLAGMCSCASAVPLSHVEELASRGALGDIF